MILNDRDKAILEFIELCPSTTFIIQSLFFPSTQRAQRRMNALYNEKLVKRYRSHINENYIYYTDKKPKQIEHTLYLSKLYAYWILNNYRIIKFKREIVLGSIRPDAIAIIKKGTELTTYLVEVEISNNPISKKIKAYEDFYLSECVDLLGFRPDILFITNKKIPQTDLKYHVIQLDQL